VIPQLTKIIRSRITFVSQNVISHRLSGVSLLAVSNVNNPAWLVVLPYVMWSAHFFVTHIQTVKISSWNDPTVHVCCFMLASTSTKTFVSQVRKTVKKSLLAGSLLKVKSSLGLLHLGLRDRPSVPRSQIVPSVISRGAPHHAAQEASISEGRKLHKRILPSARNELQLMGSFTCPEVGTWDRLFDFLHAENFFRRKNPTASARFELVNSGTRGQHANH
jgi:hypothetical protein